MTRGTYRVAVTADVVRPDGSSVHGDLGLDRLTDAGLEWFVLPTTTDPVPAHDLVGVDALLNMGHAHITPELLAQAPSLRHVARFGAGYETVDVPACTAAGVVVTNTPGAIRRPLAVAGLTMLLALSHHLLAKDALTRRSDWGARERFRGAPLDGATLGIVGFGSVGAELARLAAPLGLRLLGTNRRGSHPQGDALGVEFTDLDDLLRRSDHVVLTAPLNASTAGMVGARELSLMKASAFLVNIGRGGLVDTDALREVLRERRIAGAGLDVFDPEPLRPDDDLLTFDNVVLSPHSLCWTADFTRDVSTAVVTALVDVAAGRRPADCLNPEVLGVPRTG